MIRTLLLNFALLAVVLSGCSENETETAKKPSGPAAAKIEVAAIDATTLLEVRRFIGEVRSSESAELAPGGAGSVTRIDVLEGDEVKRGQVLVQLDDSIQRARLREAQAATDRASASSAPKDSILRPRRSSFHRARTPWKSPQLASRLRYSD